jgi:hypothetical protein
MKKLYIPIVRKIGEYGIVYRTTKIEINNNLLLIHIINDNGDIKVYYLPEFYR